MRRLESNRKAVARNRHAKRTREVGTGEQAKVRKAVSLDDSNAAPRIEMVLAEPVSPEYQDKWNEVLRQTMTRKQLKALTEQEEKED
jgi:uncharacterized protein (DUF4415 family)